MNNNQLAALLVGFGLFFGLFVIETIMKTTQEHVIIQPMMNK